MKFPILLQSLLLLNSLFETCQCFKTHDEQKKYKIVCYYTNWAQYRPTPGQYLPENIDANLCTHIIFSFAKINDESLLSSFEWNDESTEWSIGMYQRVINLKQQNPSLKFLLAVGGWNHNSMPFSSMVRDERKRKAFIDNSVKFLKKHAFDGLDIDWEYPASRDTVHRPEDKTFFTILCRELRRAYQPHNLMVTAAVAAGKTTIQAAYEIPKIHQYLDFINIMSYDLHGAWENVTGHNAPLFAASNDQDKTLNIDWAIKHWLSYGTPREKLILGISMYGRSFKLREGFESCPVNDIPAREPGAEGKFTSEKGFLAYYEVCEKILSKNWTYVWSEKQMVPFAYSNEIVSRTDL